MERPATEHQLACVGSPSLSKGQELPKPERSPARRPFQDGRFQGMLTRLDRLALGACFVAPARTWATREQLPINSIPVKLDSPRKKPSGNSWKGSLPFVPFVTRLKWRRPASWNCSRPIRKPLIGELHYEKGVNPGWNAGWPPLVRDAKPPRIFSLLSE